MRTLRTFTALTFFFLAVLGTARGQSLSVSQINGPGGLTITATSAGFDSGNVGFNTGFSVDGGFQAACPPEARANCTVTLTMPGGPVGPHTVTASNSNRESDSKTYTVLRPKFTMYPTCGPTGTMVAITGTNFAVEHDAAIYFNESFTGVHNYPDSLGHLSLNMTVPFIGDGIYSLSIRNSAGTNVARTFIVEAACAAIGEFVEVRGIVEISRDGVNFTPVLVGDPVHRSDSIRTGPNSQATVHFDDETTLRLASNTQFEVRQYVFDTSTHNGSALFNSLDGAFAYTSGLINKTDPPNLTIDTSFGTIGIRGTEFIGQRDQVAGTVEVDLIHGSVDISPNQTVNTTIYNAPIKIVFNGTGAITAPLTQEEYDEIKARLFPPASTDTTPPQVNVSFATPPIGQAGFFKAGQTPVLGTASASDASNVISISCTNNLTGLTAGTITGNGTVNASLNLSLTGDGIHIITCSASDGANNDGAAASSNNNAVVKIDTTGPSVIYSGNVGNYTVDQNVNITCSATDVLSGIASSTCSNVSGPAYSFNLGPNSFTAGATDNAGNLSNVSTTFTVGVTYDGLINLVNRFEAKATVAAKMIESLRGAKAAAASGNTSSANNQLNAFINQVQAQTGKSLTNAQANILTNLATALKR